MKSRGRFIGKWAIGYWYFIRDWVFFHIAGCVHTGQQPQSFCVLKKAEA